jgi:hypothetical protein
MSFAGILIFSILAVGACIGLPALRSSSGKDLIMIRLRKKYSNVPAKRDE